MGALDRPYGHLGPRSTSRPSRVLTIQVSLSHGDQARTRATVSERGAKLRDPLDLVLVVDLSSLERAGEGRSTHDDPHMQVEALLSACRQAGTCQ